MKRNPTILNPPEPRQLRFTVDTNESILDDDHQKYFGYLCRFVAWQKQFHILCNRWNINPKDYIKLYLAGEVRGIGWSEDHDFVTDYLAILESK